jgi:hypothetical protein
MEVKGLNLKASPIPMSEFKFTKQILRYLLQQCSDN